jgi:hypothetical protein
MCVKEKNCYREIVVDMSDNLGKLGIYAYVAIAVIVPYDRNGKNDTS